MGQQPNIELDPADLPRPVPEPGAPVRGRPARPGVITAPGEVPRGAAFGTPGPDTGWAKRILREADLPERSDALEAVLATLMAARASRFGRAPVPQDLEVALLILGYGPGLPEELADRRRRWLESAAHERVKGRAVLAEIDRDLLAETPEHVRYVLNR
jgi:hypothetical protein